MAFLRERTDDVIIVPIHQAEKDRRSNNDPQERRFPAFPFVDHETAQRYPGGEGQHEDRRRAEASSDAARVNRKKTEADDPENASDSQSEDGPSVQLEESPPTCCRGVG